MKCIGLAIYRTVIEDVGITKILIIIHTEIIIQLRLLVQQGFIVCQQPQITVHFSIQ